MSALAGSMDQFFPPTPLTGQGRVDETNPIHPYKSIANRSYKTSPQITMLLSLQFAIVSYDKATNVSRRRYLVGASEACCGTESVCQWVTLCKSTAYFVLRKNRCRQYYTADDD